MFRFVLEVYFVFGVVCFDVGWERRYVVILFMVIVIIEFENLLVLVVVFEILFVLVFGIDGFVFIKV